MGLEKPLTQRTFVQSVVTPATAKVAGDDSINRAFVMLTIESSATPLVAGDIVFVMLVNQRIRVGYCNGADGVNTSNPDTIQFQAGQFIVDSGTAMQFRTDLTYKALAF